MDVSNLKPNIFFVQRSWRILYNVFEALGIDQLVRCREFDQKHKPQDSVGTFVAAYRLYQV